MSQEAVLDLSKMASWGLGFGMLLRRDTIGIPLELFNEHYECKLKEESSHDK